MSTLTVWMKTVIDITSGSRSSLHYSKSLRE